MFKPKNYAGIFDQRGDQYHRAMVDYPDARAAEFETVIAYAKLDCGHAVADFPAGGAYLFQYLSEIGIAAADYYPLETSRYFYSLNHYSNAELHEGQHPDLGAARFDRLISLAGLHHIDERATLYRHFFKALKPGGRLVIADVLSGSPVDEFLNNFVDRHSALGHEGIFLSETDRAELEAAGFARVEGRIENYSWRFATTEDRARCCQLMFGIDSDVDTLNAALVELFAPDAAELPWQLYFIVADKA